MTSPTTTDRDPPPYLLAALAGLVVLGIYIVTLAPTTAFWDTSEYIAAAYVLGMERQVGSLEPGKWADFAILDEDPYEVDPMRLKDIGIWGTALAGRLQPA